MKEKRRIAGGPINLVLVSAVTLAVALSGRLTPPSNAASIRIELQPVLTTGLSQPVFLTHSQDGSGRLFIVEQPGRIKVLPPGSEVPTVFLDISSKVLSGGEQGLLGLAFHPRYPTDPRFFVDYTRKPDGATVLYCPQYAAGGRYRSVLALINLETPQAKATLRCVKDDGSLAGAPREVSVPGNGKVLVDDPAFFGDFGPGLTQGYVEIRSSGPLLSGSVTFEDVQGQNFTAALPLVSSLQSRIAFGQLSSDATYFTGIAIVNPEPDSTDAQIEVFEGSGRALASGIFPVPARGRTSRLVTEYFPELIGQNIGAGYIKVTASAPVASYALFGTNDRNALSAIPAPMAPGK